MAPNVEALRLAVEVARALGCELRGETRFLRKHYFYPDLPSNYQRTSEPVGERGSLEGVAIRELHVEEDPGALDLATGRVAYDRSGAPLLEIVTEPGLRDPAHARRFLQELRLVLAHLDAAREEAGLKADCNLSVEGGERAEVKNVNSVRNVERALVHEAERQTPARARGERLERETRHFDETTGRTTRLRAKESEADYRYLPDPDLAPVDLQRLAADVPPREAPLDRRARLAALVGVAPEAASPLLEERALTDAFEEAGARAGWRLAFDWFVRDLRADLDYRGIRFAASGLAAADLAALLEAVRDARVTPIAARRIQREALGGGAPLAAGLRAELGAGGGDVDAAARAAIAANPKAVEDYRAGKGNAINFLVGAAMRQLHGRAPAEDVRNAVLRALSASP
jgi:aspartyl-tRNA(Asn)/glutamyl-tRNA(Gln) amidotransferase subunit B